MTTQIELILRLLLAAGLGAAIGVERELRQKPAGLRTNILIALGSALFVANNATECTRVLAAVFMEKAHAQAMLPAAASPISAPQINRGVRTCKSISAVSIPSRLIVSAVKRKIPA